MSNKNELISRDMSSVAVIITCYNLGQYIIEAIESVKSQSVRPQEIIVIDDGSNDENTVSIIDSLANDADIKLIKQNNQGVSSARNNAAKLVSSEYILFVDADDVLEKDYIKLTKRVLDNDRNGDLGFVTTWVKNFGLSDGTWETQGSDYKDEIISNEICGTSLMRKKMFDDVGGYSLDMAFGYEDWDFWISAIENGYSWGVIKEPLFLYRIRSDSRNKNALKKDRLIRESIVSRHPGVYLDRILEQSGLIKKQTEKITLLNDRLLAARDNAKKDSISLDVTPEKDD